MTFFIGPENILYRNEKTKQVKAFQFEAVPQKCYLEFSGLFLFYFSVSENLHLAVLHPRKLTVYSISGE